MKQLDTFDIKQDNDNNESLREMKNYLAVKCDELSLKIIDFVKYKVGEGV